MPDPTTCPDRGPRVLLGAYALGTHADATWDAGLTDLDIDGLEHPLPPDDGPQVDAAALTRRLPAHWELMITCVPTVMSRLADDSRYGLASQEEAGRRRAIDDVRRALDLAARTADLSGRPVVTAVEVHSAPGPRHGSSDRLARSLTELVEHLPAGTELVLEHCDAAVPGQAGAKGFFTLADELTVLARTGGATAGLNWGRSAIEGRSPALPDDHAREAAASGLLSTVVLSGAVDQVGPWGAPWSDTHIPPSGDDPALAASAPSLLAPDRAAAWLAASGPVRRTAVKVAARPRDASPTDLLNVARASVAVLRDGLHQAGRL